MSCASCAPPSIVEGTDEVSPAVVEVADGQPTPRVLIVDDSPESRYAMRRVLTRAGFAVDEADTGAQALLRARQNPDLMHVSSVSIEGVATAVAERSQRHAEHLSDDVAVLVLRVRRSDGAK